MGAGDFLYTTSGTHRGVFWRGQQEIAVMLDVAVRDVVKRWKTLRVGEWQSGQIDDSE